MVPGLRLTAVPAGFDGTRWHVSMCVDALLPAGPYLSGYDEWMNWPAWLNRQLGHLNFMVKLVDANNGDVPVTDVRLHVPRSVDGGMDRYWEKAWAKLFENPEKIPISVMQGPDDPSARKPLSYDPVEAVNYIKETHLAVAVQTAREQVARLGAAASQTVARNESALPVLDRFAGPRRRLVEAAFQELKFFIHENDSDQEKYQAQLAHDRIFKTNRVGEQGDKPGLIAALRRLQSWGQAPEVSAFEAQDESAFLTAGTYRTYSELFGVTMPGLALGAAVGTGGRRLTSAPRVGLAKAMLFHTPGGDSVSRRKPKDYPIRSFMERLLLLRHQPSLRKLLGLTLDLSFMAAFPSPSTGRIQVSWMDQSESLWTAYDQFVGSSTTARTKQFFLPRSIYGVDTETDKLDIFTQGLMELQRPLPNGTPSPDASGGNRYALGLVQSSSAFLKAVSDAQPSGTSTQAFDPQEEMSGLTPFRPSGLSLFDRMAEQSAAARLSRDNALRQSAGRPPASDTILYAEDLLLGMRPDIQRDSGTPNWVSTVRHKSRLDFLDTRGKEPTVAFFWEVPDNDVAGEGFVSPSSMVDRGIHKLPPELFRYDGWPQATDLPFLDTTPDPQDAPGQEMPLRNVTSAVRHSVIRLIYEQKYWSRVRAAFLDGSGLSVDDLPGDTSHRIGSPEDPRRAPLQFKRTRHVGGPVLLLEHSSNIKDRYGENLTTVVQRSGQAPGIHGEAFTRVLVPPSIAPFDAYPNGKALTEGQRLIRCYTFAGGRDSWPAEEVEITPPKDPQKKPEPVYQNIPHWQGALSKSRPRNMKSVYLPDPEAGVMEILLQTGSFGANAPKAAVVRLGDDANSLSWPFFRPVFVKLVRAKSNQEETFTYQLRSHGDRVVLEVDVLPGAEVNVEARYLLNEDKFLLAKPLQSAFEAASKTGLRLPEPNSRHWLFSQPTSFTLIHAMPEPVFRPSFAQLELDESKIDSTVQFFFDAKVHVASTAKIEIWAKWEDPVDNPKDGSKPECETREILVKSFDIPQSMTNDLLLSKATGQTFPLSHSIGDFKHHRVTYGIRGISRYTSFFKPEAPPPFDWSKENTVELIIPNRTQLDALKPQYLIPLIRREFVGGFGSDTVSRFRRARYLRVYLARPFASSGQGELVGIICPRLNQEGGPVSNPDLYGTVLGAVSSVWGQSPAWDTAPITRPLSLNDFPGIKDHHNLTMNVTSDLTEGPTNISIAVAGFEPWYDQAREMWCCDIPLPRRATYRAQFRLALVRFQPRSLENLHVSTPTSMAFSSVMPDRLLIVHRLDGTGRRYAVSIFGVAPEGNFVRQTDPSRPRSNAMELRVEERFAGTNGEFCWSPTAVDWPTQKGEVLEIYPESSMSPGVFPIQDVVDEQSDLAGVSVWRTGFILPNRKNGSHYRITAREREDWLTEDSDGEPVPWSETKTIIKGRYVYIDELTL